MSCSRKQHSDSASDKAQTSNPSIPSLLNTLPTEPLRSANYFFMKDNFLVLTWRVDDFSFPLFGSMEGTLGDRDLSVAVFPGTCLTGLVWAWSVVECAWTVGLWWALSVAVWDCDPALWPAVAVWDCVPALGPSTAVAVWGFVGALWFLDGAACVLTWFDCNINMQSHRKVGYPLHIFKCSVCGVYSRQGDPPSPIFEEKNLI